MVAANMFVWTAIYPMFVVAVEDTQSQPTTRIVTVFNGNTNSAQHDQLCYLSSVLSFLTRQKTDSTILQFVITYSPTLTYSTAIVLFYYVNDLRMSWILMNKGPCLCLSEKRCPSITASANGAITMAGDAILGNIATFKCNAGYQLVGSQKRVCAADGQWSGVQPTCNGKTSNNLFVSNTWQLSRAEIRYL